MSFGVFALDKPNSSGASRTAASGTPPTLPTIRADKRDPELKIDVVLTAISGVNWKLGDFLYHIFLPPDELVGTYNHPGKASRTTRRTQILSKLLSGDSTYKLGQILELIYNPPFSRPSSQYYDASRNFSTTRPSNTIDFTKPALSTWALQLVAEEMRRESGSLISRKAGLRARASKKKKKSRGPTTGSSSRARMGSTRAGTLPDAEQHAGDSDADEDQGLGETDEVEGSLRGLSDEGDTDREEEESSDEEEEEEQGDEAISTASAPSKGADPTVSWDMISQFSLSSLENKYKALAPVTWHVVWQFMRPTKVRAVRIYRPTNIVSSFYCKQMDLHD